MAAKLDKKIKEMMAAEVDAALGLAGLSDLQKAQLNSRKAALANEQKSITTQTGATQPGATQTGATQTGATQTGATQTTKSTPTKPTTLGGIGTSVQTSGGLSDDDVARRRQLSDRLAFDEIDRANAERYEIARENRAELRKGWSSNLLDAAPNIRGIFSVSINQSVNGSPMSVSFDRTHGSASTFFNPFSDSAPSPGSYVNADGRLPQIYLDGKGNAESVWDPSRGILNGKDAADWKNNYDRSRNPSPVSSGGKGLGLGTDTRPGSVLIAAYGPNDANGNPTVGKVSYYSGDKDKYGMSFDATGKKLGTGLIGLAVSDLQKGKPPGTVMDGMRDFVRREEEKKETEET